MIPNPHKPSLDDMIFALGKKEFELGILRNRVKQLEDYCQSLETDHAQPTLKEVE